MSQPPGASSFLTPGPNADASRYNVNAKIVVASLALLCFVVLFILALHVYAKWFWSGYPRRQAALWRRRHFPRQEAIAGGLDKTIVDSLPIFIYKLSQKGAMECAVCLSELQENDKGRILPRCSHSFHAECIDMWFLSNTTCPLCRRSADPVEPRTSDANSDELELRFTHAETGPPGLLTTVDNAAPDVPIGFNRPNVERANAEPLPSPGWRWRRSISDRFSRNAQAGVQFPTNVLFWGNNAHVSSHTNAPQVLGLPRLEPHMALHISPPTQTLMSARCPSSGADELYPSSQAERPCLQQDKPSGTGFSVFKRFLSRDRKVFAAEQEVRMCGHAAEMSSRGTASGS